MSGATGAAGPSGATGAAGPSGAQGPPGPLTTVLVSGKTLKGVYTAIGRTGELKQRFGAAICFQIPLAAAPTAHFIPKGEPKFAECPGTATAPAASPGNLCVYESQHQKR